MRLLRLSAALVPTLVAVLSSPAVAQDPAPAPPAPSTSAPGPANRSAAYPAEFDRARLLLRRHEYFEALKAFQKANGYAGGQSAECYAGMAEAMVGMKTWPNVLQAADTALSLAQNDPLVVARAHAARGQAFTAMAEKDETKLVDAERAFRAALEADPGSRTPDLHFNLGVVLMKQSKDEDGKAELEQEIAQRAHGTTADDARALIANPRRAREDFAPDFEAETADGAKLTLDTLKGSVVLLDFWSGTCPPCTSAIPALRKLRESHAAPALQIISIVDGGNADEWKKYTAKNRMSWPQVMDDHHSLQRTFDVRDVPAYVLVDAEGVVRMRVTGKGFNQARELQTMIERMLAK